MNSSHVKVLALVFEALEPEYKSLGMTRQEYRDLSREMWTVWAEHVKAGRPRIENRPIPIHNVVKLYWHCAMCMRTRPEGKSMEEWGEYQGGWTEIGFQFVCKRHRCNVMHIDFEGQQHPSDGSAQNIPKILLDIWPYGKKS